MSGSPLTLNRSDRIQLNGCWRVIGLAVVDAQDHANCSSENSQDDSDAFPIDTALVGAWIRTVSPVRVGPVKAAEDRHRLDPDPRGDAQPARLQTAVELPEIADRVALVHAR